MIRRLLAGAITGCGLVVLACLLMDAHAQTTASGASDKEVFGLSKLWNVHLDVSAKEYQAIEPAPGFGFGFPGGSSPKQKKEKHKRDRDRNLFGVEFPWVQGDLTIGTTTFKNVGLRYDGNATYFSSASDIKRPFRVELSRHAKQPFHGLNTINLHPGSMDPTRGREALAYSARRPARSPSRPL